MRHLNNVKVVSPLLILTFVLLAATGALAGPRDHDGGFFLRLSTGMGSTSTSLSDGVDEMTLSGTAGDLNIAIGGMISKNLALHGTLFGWSAADPKVELNGIDAGDLPGTMTAAAFGIGLTYYFMPANIYLSGSAGSGSMELDIDGGSDGKTDSGLFMDFTLGKEWWVGDEWGLGVAGGLEYHSFPDPDINENWTGTSYTIRFTASMN